MKELNSKFSSSCLWSVHSFFSSLDLFTSLIPSISITPFVPLLHPSLNKRNCIIEHIYTSGNLRKNWSQCADSFKYQFCSLLTAWKSASTLRLFWLQSQLLTRLSRRTYMLYNYKFYALNKTLIHQTWSMFPHLQVLHLFLPNIWVIRYYHTSLPASPSLPILLPLPPCLSASSSLPPYLPALTPSY